MTQTKMSLHRVIAEIKSIESKLATIQSGAFVFQTVGDDMSEVAAVTTKSQSEFDKFSSLIANLATLKAARNKANSTVAVTIAGKTLTIDEALAAKSALVHKKELIRVLQAQFVNGQRNVDAAKAAIDQRVNQQISTMFGATRKASEEEINLLRSTAERASKVTLVYAAGLKEKIEKLVEEVGQFTTEVDYVLSEANATNVVDVSLV